MNPESALTPTDPIVYLNGDWLPLSAARISPLDRGFLFADGIYEVIPVYQGTPFGLVPHLERLQCSLAALHLTCVLEWSALFRDLIAHNGGGDLSLYLQVTRGAPPKREHKIDPTITPTVFAMATPLRHNLSLWREGIAVNTVTDSRWQRCDIKSVSLLANILGLREAQVAGAQDALMVRDGHLLETSAGNLMLIRDGVLLTPPCTPHILSGITRLIVLELAQQHGIPFEERPLPEDFLDQADELMMLSSTKELVPIVRVDGLEIGEGTPGPSWRTLFTHYQQRKIDECGPSAGIVL